MCTIEVLFTVVPRRARVALVGPECSPGGYQVFINSCRNFEGYFLLIERCDRAGFTTNT